MPGAAGEYQPIGPGSSGASSGGGGAVNEVINTDGSLTVSPTTGNVVASNNFANPSATAGPAAVDGSAVTSMRSDAAPAIQLGSATQKGIVQVDGSTITASAGVITAVGGASGANPTATAGPNAVNGSATTFMRSDAAPAIQKASSSQFGIVEVDGNTITSAGGVISAATGAAPASGRVTLSSGVPVMTATVSGATTVYFTPYKGNIIPIYNGSIWVPTMFSELSQATTDTSKSPAAVAANKLYDIFVWNDGGTIRATRGPAWSSGTSRGTGAGTTQLTLQNGIYVNANAITNGPGANLGTYVGTIGSNGSSTIDFILGGSGSGGVAAVLNLWNYFNRVSVLATVVDSGTSYTYSTGSARQARASAGNQATFISGIAEDASHALVSFSLTPLAGTGAFGIVAAVLDSTTTTPLNVGITATGSGITQTLDATAAAVFPPQIGSHVVSVNQNTDSLHGATFDNNSNDTLLFSFLM